MGLRFEDEDMSGATFRGVSLRRAVFEGVFLKEAKFHNVNLEDVSIDFAAIKGMRVNGVRIDGLVSGELDRRDPERVRLRMGDPHDPAGLVAQPERVRQRRRVRAQLHDAEVVIPRPGQHPGCGGIAARRQQGEQRRGNREHGAAQDQCVRLHGSPPVRLTPHVVRRAGAITATRTGRPRPR